MHNLPLIGSLALLVLVPGFLGSIEEDPDRMRFGRSVLTLPDIDGDGHHDFAVGAPLASVGKRERGGRVFVFSGRDRRLLNTWSAESKTHFGQTLALVGDANRDGAADVKVGFAAPGDGYDIRSARTGGVLRPAKAEAEAEPRQETKTNRQELRAGDLNGDEAEDIVWSVPVHLRVELNATSGADPETLLWTASWMDCGPHSGLAFDLFDDVDQDGIRDILVGTSHWLTDGVPTPPAEGNVRVLSGATGKALWIMTADGRSMLEQFLDLTRWEKRLLLLSGPAAEVKQQMQELADDFEGVVARDIVVIDLTSDTAMERIGDLRYRPMSSNVLERFSIPKDRLQLTLVGKDGGVKQRYDKVTKTSDIWPLIDAMPMRRREKHERGK